MDAMEPSSFPSQPVSHIMRDARITTLYCNNEAV
jgi:hypothetical protein